MYTLIYRPSVTEVIFCILISAVYVLFVFEFIDQYFEYKATVSCIVILITLVLLTRVIGTFLMYPGTFNYLNEQILKNESDYLLLNIHKDLLKLQSICKLFSNIQVQKIKKRYFELYDSQVYRSISSQLKVIRKAYSKNQERTKIIQIYEQIIRLMSRQIKVQKIDSNEKTKYKEQQDHYLNRTAEIIFQEVCLQDMKVSQNSITLQKIMKNPQIFRKLTCQLAISQIRYISNQICSLSQQLWELIFHFSRIKQLKKVPQTNEIEPKDPIKLSSWKIVNWFLFSQKLFTMDSYFVFWDNVFEYSTLMIQVQKGVFIECAVIHGQKNRKIKKSEKKSAVLFNNPNGAILQAFALTSSYINFYLKWGFEIVLWNYRGYGKSNGFSSSHKSISDVQKVYKNIAKKFNLQISIVHGYSIGGISAINLCSILNKDESNPIKLLIADRTFSSIDRVAKGFITRNKKLYKFISKVGQKIVKLFLWSECVNNAKAFRQCKCKKILIHDKNDQIISEQGSLKRKLLQYVLDSKQNTLGSSNVSDEQLQPVQQVSFNKIREIAHKFAEASSSLYAKGKTNYQRVMKIIYDTDGAGLEINLHLDLVLENGNNRRTKQQIQSESEQYIIGLIIYGPKLNPSSYGSLNEEKQSIRQKLQHRIKLMLDLSEKTNSLEDKENISKIIECLRFACEMHEKTYSTTIREKFGDLIVSKVGHNGELKSQYYRLEAILKSIFDLK